MQVFDTFFKIARKKLLSSFIYFFIFIMLCIIIANVNSKHPAEDFQTEALRICIFDQEQTDASQALTDYLASIHQTIPLENDKETLLDHLFYRNVDYILEIPEGFEENLLRGKTKDIVTTIKIPDTYNGSFVNEQINTYLKTIQLYLAGGFSLTDALSSAADDLIESKEQVTVLSFEDTGENETNNNIYYFFQYLAYALLAMLLSGMTPILTTFLNKDLSKRITCSALTLSSKNLQLILGCSIYSLVNWLVIILTSGILYGFSAFSERVLLCILNSFLLLLICLAITLTVSCFAPDYGILGIITNIITLSMCFLCGVFVPQSLLGNSVLAFSKYLPLYWYTRANNMIAGFSSEPFSYQSYWHDLEMELLFVAALFAIALAATKIKNVRRIN